LATSTLLMERSPWRSSTRSSTSFVTLGARLGRPRRWGLAPALRGVGGWGREEGASGGRRRRRLVDCLKGARRGLVGGCWLVGRQAGRSVGDARWVARLARGKGAGGAKRGRRDAAVRRSRMLVAKERKLQQLLVQALTITPLRPLPIHPPDASSAHPVLPDPQTQARTSEAPRTRGCGCGGRPGSLQPAESHCLHWRRGRSRYQGQPRGPASRAARLPSCCSCLCRGCDRSW